MFDACVQPGTTIIEVGPYTFYSVRVKTLYNRIVYYSHINKEQFQQMSKGK